MNKSQNFTLAPLPSDSTDSDFDPVALAASVPSVELIHRLAGKMGPALRSDVHLAFTGINSLRFGGLLVTEESIHQPIAFFPISSEFAVCGALWRNDVTRQLAFALTLAELPESNVPAIRLDRMRENLQPMPSWLSALSCVPISADWDGELHRCMPFCPAHFANMASQPHARLWLESKTFADTPSQPRVRLTRREQQVLEMLCIGDGEKQIAYKLKISMNTVHVYVKNLYAKHFVNSRSELLARFVRLPSSSAQSEI